MDLQSNSQQQQRLELVVELEDFQRQLEQRNMQPIRLNNLVGLLLLQQQQHSVLDLDFELEIAKNHNQRLVEVENCNHHVVVVDNQREKHSDKEIVDFLLPKDSNLDSVLDSFHPIHCQSEVVVEL